MSKLLDSQEGSFEGVSDTVPQKGGHRCLYFRLHTGLGYFGGQQVLDLLADLDHSLEWVRRRAGKLDLELVRLTSLLHLFFLISSFNFHDY